MDPFLFLVFENDFVTLTPGIFHDGSVISYAKYTNISIVKKDLVEEAEALYTHISLCLIKMNLLLNQENTYEK